MLYKALSVKQPYAALICAGVKTVENRTWKTDYRGKILIHASGSSFAYPDFCYLPVKYQEEYNDRIDKNNWKDAPQSMLNYYELLRMTYKFYGKDIEKQEPPEKWLKETVKKYGFFLPSQAIIGEVTLSDIADNLYDVDDSSFAERDSPYYWILTDPLLYENKEIKINVLGHLRLWNFAA